MPAEHLTVQRIYRGWQRLGIASAGALVFTAAVALLVRGNPTVFGLTLAAAACAGTTLVIFFMFTYPANRQTREWTVLPENCEALRRQWEYSHATSAGLYFVALILLILSLLAGDRR